MNRKRMTLDEIAALPRETLKTAEIAAVMGVEPYTAVLMAKHGDFPFQVPFSGNRPKYPKRPFLRYMGWQEEQG